MSKKIRRSLIASLTIFLLTLAALEVALAFVDPWGVRSIYQLRFLETHYTGPLGGEYRLPPGTYQFEDWQATVGADMTRAVPDSGRGCTLTVFGDSVAWGWGVGDAETFANRLAQRYPHVRVVNEGMIGYNSQQVRHTIERSAFDYGIYLIINNDASPPLAFGGNPAQPGHYAFSGFGLLEGRLPALRAYYLYVILAGSAPPVLEDPSQDWLRYHHDLEALSTRDNLLLLAFDEPFGQETARLHPVRLLPPYTAALSRADSHPDGEGHRQIAAAIDSLLEPILDRLPAYTPSQNSACVAGEQLCYN